MNIIEITPEYSVSPQIGPEDIGLVTQSGFTTVICNRPDGENPPHLSMEAISAAVEAAGLIFVGNPIAGPSLTHYAFDRQRGAISKSSGPVLAYCASGTRSAVLWAFAEIGARTVDDILSATARAGYALDGLAPQLEAMARRSIPTP